MVTTQKRSEKVTEVPLSVSVIQAESLANKGATSLTDFAAYVPGLAVSNNGAPGINGVVIRGLATSYNNSFNAPLVVTYIDDQPTGASAGGFGGARGPWSATHLFNRMPPLGHRTPGPIPVLLQAAQQSPVYDGFRVPTLEDPVRGSNRLFNRACLDCHAAVHGSNHPSSTFLGH